MAKLNVLIVGAGNRGWTFSRLLKQHPNARVSAVADLRDYHRTVLANACDLPADMRFKDWHEIVARKERVADAVVIALPDAMHTEAALAFAAAGYHLFLEKPMAPTWAECCQIAAAAEANHVTLTICHELRYTRYFQKMKELLESRCIGEVMTVQHFESVVYWHQAHSYVRGNWRNEEASSFMLLAKSCHDLDILSYLLGKKCLRVNSFGALSHFRSECAPPGSAARCVDCPAEVESFCPYSALKIYFRDRAAKGRFDWPVDVVSPIPTREELAKALQQGPYGRCVYCSDNDVVDHQTVNMEFEGGVTAVFTMTAFTRDGAQRETRICGTRGEIVGNGETITVHRFLDDSSELFDVNRNSTGNVNDGHGGGDNGIIDAWVKSLICDERESTQKDLLTNAAATLESHRIVFAAEAARRSGVCIEMATWNGSDGSIQK